MNILVTGSNGFLGKNLIAQLRNIQTGKANNYQIDSNIHIYEYDVDNSLSELEAYCKKADFVYHLAGVNRPKNTSEFMDGNYGFTSVLLSFLEKYNNNCPIMLSSSIQANLNNEYGKSKKAGEELLLSYSKKTSVRVLIYRFPNIFGKWCRPNYNSVIATFCHNIANDKDIKVNDPLVMMNLVYIDDVVEELILALESKEHRKGNYCEVPTVHTIELGSIVKLLYTFKEQSKTLFIPDIPRNSFAKKLYSTYLSYLPKERFTYPIKMNVDDRGSFTELFKSKACGQISVNISKPGITKGEHWHHTKCELFVVVEGEALIQMRKIDSNEVINFKVSGEKIEAVCMVPGYTHNIINLSEVNQLITIMWSNETFDVNKPDTYFLPVSSKNN